MNRARAATENEAYRSSSLGMGQVRAEIRQDTDLISRSYTRLSGERHLVINLHYDKQHILSLEYKDLVPEILVTK